MHSCGSCSLQVKVMKRVRDIRDQLLGLCDRVEIELTSKLGDVEAIKKAITAGKPRGHLFGEPAGDMHLRQLSGMQGLPGCVGVEGTGSPVLENLASLG